MWGVQVILGYTRLLAIACTMSPCRAALILPRTYNCCGPARRYVWVRHASEPGTGTARQP